MENIFLWYASRATGLVALVLLTLVVVLGILGSLRVATRSFQRFAVAAIHRNIALVTLAFLAVHIVSGVVDTFVDINWPDAVIPFGSAYRPVWLGLGAAAFDILVALVITSLLRPRINPRLWRAVHWAAYACWPLALVHGLGTGTDSRSGWPLVLVLTCLGIVAIAVVARLISAREYADGQPAGQPATAGQAAAGQAPARRSP
jgi:methionine sulfoxide reductase heme-binding subunit